MTSSVDDLLRTYRSAATSERDKGTYFERLCAAYLAADPVQKEQYDAVWTWADWVAGPGMEWAEPNGWTARDVGIDLVARLRGHSGYAAVQCKFYDPDHRIAQSDLSGFLTVSSKPPFVRRIVMDTTRVEWSSNAEAMITGLAPPVIRIGLTELRASPVQWATFASQGELLLAPKKELRPHQSQALEDVRAGFAQHDRGKLIMACGTGKTFTALRIAEDQVGADGMVLFLVPSLALMAQTVREWTADTSTPLRSFAVCSDTQVGKRRVSQDDVAEITSLDLAFPATTDAAKLAQSVADAATGAMTVVFATYQSIGVISDAQLLHAMPRFNAPELVRP